MNTELEIFDELGRLCVSDGYIHALAFICFKENFIGYSEEISGEDLLKKHSWDRLIHTEILTLLGLIVKSPINFSLPDPQTIQRYVEETYRLLTELHEAMSAPFLAQITTENLKDKSFNPLNIAGAFREPIFYSGESAYSFQFREFAVPKYSADNQWLRNCKGFCIETARDVVQTFCKLQNRNLAETLYGLRAKPVSEWSLLPGYSVNLNEIAQMAGYDREEVVRILAAFTLPANDRNEHFRSLHDFNQAASTPLLMKEGDSYILFEQYSLVQALYESPFYWMVADRSYKDTAMEHRGRFAEEFVRGRLEGVFGREKVFGDVKVFASKGQQVTDIDVLVLFGNRAVVVQAKSKKLTLESRRGNDGQIKTDFQQAIQDAYDQAYEAAAALGTSTFSFVDNSGKRLRIPQLKQIFIICVVSDPYPALSFQAKQFLRTRSDNIIQPPIVTEIFAIDAMTEMLDSPLWLLSYIHRRTLYSHKLFVPDEFTALAYHLKKNLWLDDKYDMVQLSDDFSCDLDAAMSVRRDGIPGKRTPEGILTSFVGTTIQEILKQVEARPEGAALDFAFTVLTFDEETTRTLSDGIDKIADLSNGDGMNHDLTMSMGSKPATGVTIHCNDDAGPIAKSRLLSHCEARKYIHKAITWFGICIEPHTKAIRFGVELSYPWKPNTAMDRRKKALLHRNTASNLGHNDPCPCGSGKKYKKCCLN